MLLSLKDNYQDICLDLCDVLSFWEVAQSWFCLRIWMANILRTGGKSHRQVALVFILTRVQVQKPASA